MKKVLGKRVYRKLRINSANGSCTCGSLCKILGKTAQTNVTYTA